jgi:hypothetical protein
VTDIIRFKDGDYDRYQELLIKRDYLKKEAGSIETYYIRTFGDLINKAFKAQIKCIKIKKEIEFCYKKINSGREIDVDELNSYILKVMFEYNKKLHEMYEETREAKESRMSSQETVEAVKKLYRTIAKKIHPDIHKETTDDPVLQDYWNRTVIAYHANDKKELEELEVLITKYLNEHQGETIWVDIPDIREKIKKIEAEIEEITSTDPYQYKYLLVDDDQIEQTKNELKQTAREYEEHAEDLQIELDKLLKKEGVE